MRTWLITGCSTGIGRAIAGHVLAIGEQAVVTARRAEDIADIVATAPDRAIAAPLDVARPDQVRAAVQAAVDRFGAIDVLVNNAGYGYVAAIEEGDDAAVRAMFDVNFFGALDMIRAVLPGMRARGGGLILNISSLAGRVANPATGFYSASKHALEGLSGALAREVAPLGIRVCSIAPGMFRTDFSGRSLRSGDRGVTDYGHVHDRMGLVASADGRQQGDPLKLAAAVVAVADMAEPPVQLLLGGDAYRAVAARMEETRAEMEACRDLSCGTDFDATES
ncbi:MAG TPA: oxidoreductase [Sphingomonas sp.]|nr:oxidoreductase [Sphingomonas sp.]